VARLYTSHVQYYKQYRTAPRDTPLAAPPDNQEILKNPRLCPRVIAALQELGIFTLTAAVWLFVLTVRKGRNRMLEAEFV